MKKIEVKVIPSVNYSDITRFITANIKGEWGDACKLHQAANNDLMWEDVEEPVEGYVQLVKSVSNLDEDNWIRKFAEVQEIPLPFHIIFTD